MRDINPFSEFMSAIVADARIGTTHIALFVALYDLWLEDGKTDGLNIQPSRVMKRAKISARSTYVRAIRNLGE